MLRDYVDHTKSMAAEGAQVIVIPEKLSVVVDPLLDEIDSLFKEAATANQTRFVIGVLRITGRRQAERSADVFARRAECDPL